MEPDETKSIQQPHSPNLNQTNSKTPPTVQIGNSPLPQQPSSDESNPQPGWWEGLRLPIKWAIAILVPLFLLIFLGSGLFNLAKSAIESIANKQPPAVIPTTEKPIITPSSTNNPTTGSNDKNNCTDLPTRMNQAKITAGQVDKLFYQTYPDRVNKPLTINTITERNMRQEWCSIANKLINQKLLK